MTNSPLHHAPLLAACFFALQCAAPGGSRSPDGPVAQATRTRLPGGGTMHRLARIEGYGNPRTGELWMRAVPVDDGSGAQSDDGVSGIGLALKATTPGHCDVVVEADGKPNDNPAGTFEYYSQYEVSGSMADAPSFEPGVCHSRLPGHLQGTPHMDAFDDLGVGCALQHVGNFSGVDYSRVLLDIDVFNGSVEKHSPYGPPYTTGTVETPATRNAPRVDLGLWDFGPMPSGLPGETTGPHLKNMWIYFKNGDTTDFNFTGYILGEVYENCGSGSGDGVDDDCDGVVDNGCAIEPLGNACYLDDDCAGDLCAAAQVTSGFGEGGGGLQDDVAGACVGSVGGDFEDAAEWTLSGSVTISGGSATLPPEVSCEGGSFAQTIALGPANASEPLVVAFNAAYETFEGGPGLNALINGTPYRVDAGYELSYRSNRICLGEAAYASGSVSVAIANATAGGGSCGSNDPMYIDDLHVERAMPGECPTVAGIPSGDFSDDGSAWTVEQGTVTFAGEQANLSGNACNSSSLTMRVALPGAATDPNTAVELSFGGTGLGGASGMVLYVRVGDQVIATLPSGPVTTRRVCLPSVMRGATVDLNFQTGALGGLCANTWSATLDDVSLVTDPACADAAMLDPGFDASTPAGGIPPWRIERDLTGRGADPEIVIGGAQSGPAYLYMPQSYPCNASTAQQLVLAPDSSLVSGGPALSYWHSLDSNARGDYSVCINGSCDVLVPTVGWEQSVLCIHPSLASKPVTIVVRASGGSGTCANQYTEEHLQVDTLQLVQDLGCPWM